MRRKLRDPKVSTILIRTLKMQSSNVFIPPFGRPQTATYLGLRNGSSSRAGTDAKNALAEAEVEIFGTVVLEDEALKCDA